MKKLAIIAALAAASLLSVANAAAPSVSTTLDVQEVNETVQPRTPAQSYRAKRAMFKELRGTYNMDDGTTLRLYQSGAQFIAEVSGSEPMEVRVHSSTRLVGIGGNTILAFTKDRNGYFADVVLSKSASAG